MHTALNFVKYCQQKKLAKSVHKRWVGECEQTVTLKDCNRMAVSTIDLVACVVVNTIIYALRRIFE